MLKVILFGRPIGTGSARPSFRPDKPGVDLLHAGQYLPASYGPGARGDACHAGPAASDAFLPFSDTLQVVADAGVTALIQPGGSIRDDESIELANKLGIAMVFTGHRHFRH